MFCHRIFQSFTHKHLGGVIHLVDRCPGGDDGAGGNRQQVSSNRRSDDFQPNPSEALTTFRPKLQEYILSARETAQVHMQISPFF